jgi:glycosyltransferase involved in cell wall biosynthesis
VSYVVVIPSCNRYDYLLAALASALAQTIPPAEVIVVDDASTDRRYLDRAGELGYWPVRVIRRAVNSKVATGATYANGTARNTGLAEIDPSFDGWVAFLDDDDIWRPGKMARQLEVAARHPEAVAIGSDATVIDPAGDPVDFLGGIGGRQISPAVYDVTDLVATVNPLPNSTAIVRASAVRQLGPQMATGYPEDWDYWQRAARLGRLLRITEDLAMYRRGHAKEWQ